MRTWIKPGLPNKLTRLTLLPLLTLFFALMQVLQSAQLASAQTAPGLYDPEPPANSAYVRIIHAANELPMNILVDGKVRIKQLATTQASDYLVLPAGQHSITLNLAGKPRLEFKLDCVGMHAYSLAFTTLKLDDKPIIFEDKTIANKLKATLTAYHLQPGLGPLDISTADGKLTVFSALASGTQAVRAVNPITVDLIATQNGSKQALAQAKMVLSQGGSYSLLLIPNNKGNLQAHASQNKIERYTGK